MSIVTDKDFRSNHKENSGMDYRIEIFRELEVRIVLVRVVVYGIRYRADFHVPFLALASECRNTVERDAVLTSCDTVHSR